MAGIGPHKTFVQSDGAKIAYEVIGSDHLEHAEPLILVGGMSSLRGDWERLALCLAKDRPVLIFDHRGMGDSTLSRTGDEVITIGSMARDLLALLTFLEWKTVAICGFSMGGLVTQQLLFLPYLSVDPILLPFTVTHVLLTGTLTGPLRDKKYGLKVAKPVPGRKLTREEKRQYARPTLESTFDPRWLAEPSNNARFNWWLNRMIFGRPTRIITRAINSVRFDKYYPRLQRDIRIFVIHGKLDEIVSFSYAQDILDRIPWAKMVEIGPHPGQVESLEFGHHWFEYFDIENWRNVINEILTEPAAGPLAHL